MFDTGSVKKRINAGEVTLGGWVSTNSPASAEIMALAGFDWVAVDVEHSPASVADVEAIARATKLRGAKPLARVFDASARSIRRLLDAGMEGVIVPMIRTLDEVRAVVDAAKFPPLGRRGAGAAPVNVFGAAMGDYVRDANDGVLLMLMVETREAVENIDAILDIDGVDGIFLGPFDLSASYGIIGQITDPLILSAMDTVFAACKRHNKAAGIHVIPNDPEVLRTSIEKGANFIAMSFDANFIFQGSKQFLVTARGILGER